MTRFPSLLAFLAIVALLTAVGLQVSFADEGLAAGDRLAAEGKLDQAIASYAEVLEHDPENATAHARLGGMHLMRQHYSEAIDSFKQAISLDGEQARSFVGMGMAYLHTGRHDLARAALEQAKSLEPELGRDIDPVLAWIDGRTEPGEMHRPN